MTGAWEEGPQEKVARLEWLLADQRRFSRRATLQLHRALSRDVRDAAARARSAERRATEAERRAERAEGRARQAERELERIRASITWRAGLAVLAVPRRVKRMAQR